MKRLISALPFTAPAALIATPAFAHLPPGEYGSLAAGFSHPLFGADHVLAMVAVGLWAATLGGRALWGVPTAFVLAMAVGFGLALAGLPLPGVEPMILASVVVLGVLVAIAARIDARAAAAVAAVFAIFHGHAHGGELGGAGAAEFGIGFMLGTALLHAAGVALGLGLATAGRRVSAPVTRLLGAGAALAGLGLAFG